MVSTSSHLYVGVVVTYLTGLRETETDTYLKQAAARRLQGCLWLPDLLKQQPLEWYDVSDKAK